MSNEANQILEILEEFRQEVAATKKELLSLRTTIENVTNQNIVIVSEQILNLENKLDCVSNDRVEIEILKLKLNRLEDEVRTLKDKNDTAALA